MFNPTDDELLQSAARGSREAMAQIAQRYIGFVYHAALRQVRDPHVAEDVTQAVFVILSGKIARLKPGTHLHAWMFTTTRYAAHNALKMQARRIHHERRAAAERAGQRSDQPREELLPLLDAALAELRERDRSAVLMSYFADKSWREIGEAIGVSEEAARKRVERAIARMREFFLRRGARAGSAATVATALASAAQLSAAPVPRALVQSVTSNLLSAPAASSAACGIAEGAIHMMTWAKLKIAAGFASVVVITMLVGAAAAMFDGASTAADQKANPPPADAIVELANDTKVELLGVSKRPSAGQAWWNADGTPAAAPYDGSDGSNGAFGDNPDDQREVVLRVTGPNIDDLGVKIELANRPGWTSGGLEGVEGARLLSFAAQRKDVADVRVTVATGPWETILTQQPTGFRSDLHVAFGPAVEEDGGCVVTTSDDLIDHQARVVAIGIDGQTHESSAHMMGLTKSFRQMTTRFPLAKDEIERLEFQTRPFDQFVLFKNVSLLAGKNAGFTSEGGKLEPKAPSDK